METELMSTDYTYGDGKNRDSFNSGACKQNWGMERQCHPAWRNLGPDNYDTGAAMNSNRALDVQVYNECKQFFGVARWFAGHRNGQSGLDNPNTPDIARFREGWQWTFDNIANHLEDDVRFWVSIPAI